jgi:thioredoxin-like negative regulator of GroEL
MTLRRFLLGFTIVLLLQGSVFAWQYRDLLYFRQPVAAIRADQPETFAAHARSALSRQKLTRQHLDTIAVAADGFGKRDIEIQALERRLELDPNDVQVKLRLADALRRAGRFNDAERMYGDLLRSRNEKP